MPNKSYQYALLSMKKTLLKVKKPTVRFIPHKELIRAEECTDEGKEVIVYKAYLIGDGKPKCDDTPLRGKGWYNANLYGEKAKHPRTPFTGNICTGISTNSILIFDVDRHTKEFTLFHGENYPKFYHLGASLVMQTSETFERDFYGNTLGNYAIVFGKPITWEEIKWHIVNGVKLGLLERANLYVLKWGYITSRQNPKNREIPAPKVLKFFSNSHGDMRGIVSYIQHWNLVKDFGF
jgi:hypothetical protein